MMRGTVGKVLVSVLVLGAGCAPVAAGVDGALAALRPVYGPLAEHVVEKFDLKDREGIGIDVGGGSGTLITELCRRTSRMYWIDADIDSSRFGAFFKAVETGGLAERVGAVRADAVALPFRDAYADVVVSRGSFHYWSDLDEGLAEIHRVLKPGGVALVGRGFSPNLPVETARAVRAAQRKAGMEPHYDLDQTAAALEHGARALGLGDGDFTVIRPKPAGSDGVNYGVWLQFRKAPAARGAAPNGYRTAVGRGPDAIPLVVVRGTPYEMGRRQGELLKDDAVALVRTFLRIVQSRDPARFSDAALDAAWEDVAPHTDPRFKEELRGLADGTGLPIEVLRRAHVVPVLADYSCSSIAAWGRATKDGHLYQTRNLDWDMHVQAQEHPAIVVYIPRDGIPHVNITFAGFIGCNTGMSAEGIVLSEMGDSPGSDSPYDLHGVHFTTLFRSILQDARGLDDALRMFLSARRIKKYHYVVGDGKKPAAVKMRAHAPELLIWRDNDPRDELAPEVLECVVYQDEGRGAFGPLREAYGKIGAKEMIDIACGIPIRGGNILDVVYDATALEFWVSYGKGEVEAYRRPFVHVKLRDYLP